MDSSPMLPAKALCGVSNILTWLGARARARARAGTRGWGQRSRLGMPIEPSGKFLQVWEGGSDCCWACCRRSILVVLAAFAEGEASLGGAKNEVFAEPGS